MRILTTTLVMIALMIASPNVNAEPEPEPPWADGQRYTDDSGVPRIWNARVSQWQVDWINIVPDAYVNIIIAEQLTALPYGELEDGQLHTLPIYQVVWDADATEGEFEPADKPQGSLGFWRALSAPQPDSGQRIVRTLSVGVQAINESFAAELTEWQPGDIVYLTFDSNVTVSVISRGVGSQARASAYITGAIPPQNDWNFAFLEKAVFDAVGGSDNGTVLQLVVERR